MNDAMKAYGQSKIYVHNKIMSTEITLNKTRLNNAIKTKLSNLT